MFSNVFLWFFLHAIILLNISALIQGQNPPSSVSPLSRPAPPRPESIQDTNMYGYWTHMTDQGRAGGALLGRVAIEGDVLPWEPILVTVSCHGATAYTTQTDFRGNFGILPNKVPGVLSLQGDRERQMQTQYEGCIVQAFLTGYRSTRIAITERHLRDDPTIGTLTLSRDSQARGTAISSTSQTVPPEAAKNWSKAGAYMIAQKADKARRELEKAVKTYPAFAEAWYQLGVLQTASSPKDALACFDKAAAADPKFILPYEQLAMLASQNEDWQAVLDYTSRSLDLDPAGTMRVWYYTALADFQLAKLNSAEIAGRKMMAMDPLHNIRNGEQLFAAILARKADYAGALAHLRNCLTYTPEGPDAELLKQQIATLEHHVTPTN